MARTSTLTPEAAHAVGLIGQVVTFSNWRTAHQYRVHSIEGPSFYAFQNNGKITVDSDLTYTEWLEQPIATLLPMGASIGEGRSVEARVRELRKGVCLTKEDR